MLLLLRANTNACRKQEQEHLSDEVVRIYMCVYIYIYIERERDIHYIVISLIILMMMTVIIPRPASAASRGAKRGTHYQGGRHGGKSRHALHLCVCYDLTKYCVLLISMLK